MLMVGKDVRLRSYTSGPEAGVLDDICSTEGGSKMNRWLATVFATIALSGFFVGNAFAYVYDTFFNSYVASGTHKGGTSGARYFLFGQGVGPMAALSCYSWSNGAGQCLTAPASYLYTDGQLATVRSACDIYGRNAAVQCQGAY